MSNRSAKAITADNRYDNFVKDHVTKHSRRVISFSIRDGRVHVNGDKESLNLIDTFPELTVKDLLVKMKELGDAGDQSLDYADSTNLSTPTSPLPPMKFAFNGPNWNHVNARRQLTAYFCILGFGKAKNEKKFGQESSMPEWWPDSLSWANFSHPGKGTIPNINKILQSMFNFYDLDIQTHHTEDPAASDQQRPKKRTRKSGRAVSRRFLESDNEREEELANNNEADADTNENYAQDEQYKLPLAVEHYDTHLNEDTHQPVEEPVHYDTQPQTNQYPPVTSQTNQFYNVSYENYGYNYDYGYSNHYYSGFEQFATQSQPQQPTTSSGEQSVHEVISEARSYVQL